jgi:hypothetical protein
MREMIEVTNADRFINSYKKLENAVKKQFPEVFKTDKKNKAMRYLQSLYPKYEDDLEYCIDVRNILQHRETFNDYYYAVEPCDQMVKFIDKIYNEIYNRKTCYDICIPFKNIKCAKLTDDRAEFQKTLSIMKEKVYTHIPIIDDKKHVIGVFDENCIFNYFSENEIVGKDEVTFKTLERYIVLNRGKAEKFIFFGKDRFVDELEPEFQKQLDDGSRLEVVFLTEGGKDNQPLYGMITAWDILGREH